MMKGWLGGAYQSYLDAYDTIELCDLSENEKEVEKAKLLEARKTALGDKTWSSVSNSIFFF